MADGGGIHPLGPYIDSLARIADTGQTTEPSFYSVLQSFLEGFAHSRGLNVLVLPQPQRVKEAGAPDFAVLNPRNVPLGYIEAKDLGEDLDRSERSEQLQRYRKALPNLVLTNFLEMRWYVAGHLRDKAVVGRYDQLNERVTRRSGAADDMDRLMGAFLAASPPEVGTSQELARRLADLAALLRHAVLNALPDSTHLQGLRDALLRTLLPDLPAEAFADLYAQTLTYGLFAAKIGWQRDQSGSFSLASASQYLSQVNPFLANLFYQITGPAQDAVIRWIADAIAWQLESANFDAILSEFARRRGREDPVVHFYEDFLMRYDPEEREIRGVYYTPEPVVDFITRATDYLLRTCFQLPAGLADNSRVTYLRPAEGSQEVQIEAESHRVLVLDPAAGTGTFLYFVVRAVRDWLVAQGQGGAWPAYVDQHLIPRLFGLELMMAPYVIAHLKLGTLFSDLGAPLTSNQRVNVYLTNTLQPSVSGVASAIPFLDFLDREAIGAEEARSRLPIMVVLGNPPYSGHSANKGRLPTELIQRYKQVDGQPLHERNPKWLQDDYVKFIAFAQQRIEQTGQGILAFITNHAYLDNPTFRGMRQSLLQTFDKIYVLNLHGNSRRKERPPDGGPDNNVFDIQQGVAIALFVRLPEHSEDLAGVFYADVWGTRPEKYHWLTYNDVDTVDWRELHPASPWYLLVPVEASVVAEYFNFRALPEIMPTNSVGIVTARDRFAIALDRSTIRNRINDFRNPVIQDEEIRTRHMLRDTRAWQMEFARRAVQNEVQDNVNWEQNFLPILYRPFDQRWIYYHDAILERSRHQVMSHLTAGDNLALSSIRRLETQEFSHVMACRHLLTHHSVSLKEVNYVFPLYVYPASLGIEAHAGVAERQLNLSAAFISEAEQYLGLSFTSDGERGDLSTTFGARDLFDYIYAVLHSPTYRERYDDCLRIDFPRVPLAANLKLWRELVRLGGELVAIHVPDSPQFTSLPMTDYRFLVEGSCTVESLRYEWSRDSDTGRIYINQSQYFEGVTPGLWEFEIGGYQVAERWLSDRRGRTLTFDEITYYQRVLAALTRTRVLMQDIDDAIDQAGGWPIR